MKKTDPTFIDMNRPRHAALEAFQKLRVEVSADAGKALSEYQGTFASTSDTRNARPSNLVQLYLAGDIRVILQDAAARPDHYDARQHAILNTMYSGSKLKATDIEMNELFLQWQRPTEVEKKFRKLRSKKDPEAAENEGIVMEDGRTLAEHLDEAKHTKSTEGTFEDQSSLGDVIIL